MLCVSGIVASRHAAGRVYLAIDGHFNDRYEALVFVSEDYGQTWRAIGAGLPQASVRRIREHPVNPNLLAVGTEMGLYASFDRGGRWAALGSGLPTVPVYDVLFQERSGALVAGTHGRGIWVLDHIEALERMGPDATGSPRLFPPPPAHHTTIFPGQFWFGAGEFFAPNPPAGGVLSYYLPREIPGGVEIAIQDAAGKTVRSLRGPAQAGLNRACWDLRWDPPTDERGQASMASCSGGTRGAAGPLAAPGKFTVAVTPAGLPSMKAELLVVPEPRSKIAPGERKAHDDAVMSAYWLQRQLMPARQCAQALGGQIGGLRTAVFGSAATALEQATHDLARAAGQLNTALAGAARAQHSIDGFEGAPTAAQLRELDWAWQDAAAGVAALNQIIQQQMPAIYSAAGSSAQRWTPMKPAPMPKR
jgi:hypothetical protein